MNRYRGLQNNFMIFVRIATNEQLLADAFVKPSCYEAGPAGFVIVVRSYG